MSAENTASEVVQTVMNSDKIAFAVAGGTIATGVVSDFVQVQEWLSLGAKSLGILLTIILVVKHGIDVYKAWRDLDK